VNNSVWIEFTAICSANTDEADSLLDRLFESVSDVVCPPSANHLVKCDACQGSGVNPPLERDEEPVVGDDERWKPGLPCVICADSNHPGRIMECSREHYESSILTQGKEYVSTEEKRLRGLLEELKAIAEDPDHYADARLELLQERIATEFERLG